MPPAVYSVLALLTAIRDSIISRHPAARLSHQPFLIHHTSLPRPNAKKRPAAIIQPTMRVTCKLTYVGYLRFIKRGSTLEE
jgi:hypothetical protein